MTRWAVALEQSDADAIVTFRDQNDVRVCCSSGKLWLQGNEDQPAAMLALRGQRYRVLDDGQLLAEGNRVPLGHLPGQDEKWLPIDEWVTVEMPTAGWTATKVGRVAMRLKRSSIPAECSAILVEQQQWLDYADTVAAVRLKCWHFAAAADGRILVLGNPLPSLEGTRFVVTNRIALPAGFCWIPQVDAATVRRGFGDPDGLILWQQGSDASDGDQVELIPDDAFVAATRSAIRMTVVSMQTKRPDQ